MTDQPTAETSAGPSAGSLRDAGMPIRRAVLGDAHVDRSLGSVNAFTRAIQDVATEVGWGYAWARPGLDRRSRSLINLGMLTALRAPHELRVHVRGAINNGVTVEEIREALVHASVYCGIPAAMEAFRAANEVLVEMGKVEAGVAA